MIHTKILRTEDPEAIPSATEIIKRGGTIAFPTDTVYGLAVDPYNPQAINNIYAIKERSMEKAIPLLIGDLQHLDRLISEINESAEILAQNFWPGPLTLILSKAPELPDALSPYPTIGIRMPNHEFALNLLKVTGPLATTSANISGDANPRTGQEVLEQLGGRIDLLLDGGKTPGAVPSTVVDMSSKSIRLLRKGPITRSELSALLRENIL